MVEREVSEGLLLLELWCLPDRNPPSLNSVRRIINADDKGKHDDERTNKGLVSNDFPKTGKQKTRSFLSLVQRCTHFYQISRTSWKAMDSLSYGQGYK